MDSLHVDAKVDLIEEYAAFCTGQCIPSRPLEIFLEISNLCNLKCAMCLHFSALNTRRFEFLQSVDRGFLDEAGLSQNLHSVLRSALVVHCFGYGEPTMHPNFRSIIDGLASYEVMIDFYTNGMLLEREFCEFLVDRRVSQITISFSGASKDVYENIYIGGDFDLVLSNMRTLAEIKVIKGSTYPIININSIGFRDHVEKFENFVQLMADHGANVVTLVSLQHPSVIPQLYEHVSIMRANNEGNIIERAVLLGRKLRVRVNPEPYLRNQSDNEQEFERRESVLKREAAYQFRNAERTYGQNPISDFKEIARNLPAARPAEARTGKTRKVLGLDVNSNTAHSLLAVKDPISDMQEGKRFYCMEPFKTMFVTRNGPSKPCCHANAAGWHLGNVKESAAVDVWNGIGFSTVRRAIANGKYPMDNCASCLRGKNAPQGHFAGRLIERFLRWHEGSFGPRIADVLKRRAPDAVGTILAATPAEIMSFVQKIDDDLTTRENG